jgi:hypothetical protein
MNPAVLDAFALIISGAEGPPAYPGILGHEPDLSTARKHADAIDRTMNGVRKLVPNPGSYVAEGDFFDEAWRQSFWGPNYTRLLAVKDKYDPEGLFFVHHGVGSERWSRRLHEIGLMLGPDDHDKPRLPASSAATSVRRTTPG